MFNSVSGYVSNWTDSFGNSGSWGNSGGQKITPYSGNISLINITVSPSATYSNITIRTGSWTGTIVANSSTKVANNFMFNNVNLTNGTSYYLVTSYNGNHQYGGAGSPTYPKNDNGVQWVIGFNPTTGTEDIFNGGYDILKITYTQGAPINAPTVNITYPSNNAIFYNNTLNLNYTISNPSNVTINNISIQILNNDNNLIDSYFESYLSQNSSINDSTQFNISTSNIYSVIITTEYNLSSSSYGTVSDTKTFANSVKISSIDREGNIISGSIIYINGIYYPVNPIFYSVDNLNYSIITPLIVNSSARGYQANSTTLNINVTSSIFYNITLQSYKLILSFTQNETSFNVTAYISDLNKSYMFNNVSYIQDQNNFSNSIV